MATNRRHDFRTSSDAQVIMMHPGFGQIMVKARDLSDGGISVFMKHHVCPPVGTIVQVIIKRHTGTLNAEPVAMEVRHVQADGIVGLSFV
ncbi:MAG TPA: PilZ domain-containing protein [Pseudomonadales bacterium]